ncbi:MAG: hypothetical protein V2I48_05790, partial [Xanthomonadales bacterium]|nr:hypothetical protein [Xanthomonadales bacterium]
LYLQAMESVLGRSKKVFLDADNSGNVLYLPLDQLTGGSSASGSPMPPLVTPNNAVGVDSTAPGRNSRREGRQ